MILLQIVTIIFLVSGNFQSIQSVAKIDDKLIVVSVTDFLIVFFVVLYRDL
jgi:hypothetical protein